MSELSSRSISENPKSAIQNRKLAKIAVVVVTLAICGVRVEAQQPGKIPRIGYLTSGGNPKDAGFLVFHRALRDLGYVEGENVVIEYRTAEARQDRIPGLVAELVHLKVDVLVSTAQPAIEIAKQATKTIPIVMIATFDPVATG